MFKIPKWEDDVPTSKVDFGKTNKKQKQKGSTSEPQKQLKKQKGPTVQAKTVKKRLKKPKNINAAINTINQSKENGYDKVSKQKKIHLNKNNEKFIRSDKKSGNKTEFSSISSNNAVSKLGNIKKKKPKKRKFDDQDTTDKKTQKGHINGKIGKDVNTPSKPKKKKLNDEEMVQEGSILLEKSSKKKKSKPEIVKTENLVISRGSKLDQKKEKFRQLLKLDTNRNKITVSGDSLRQRMLERLKSAQFRFLNEKLYTTSGSEAQKLFQSDPEAFHTYHEGYQQQVKKWPVNPLDLIVKRISKMPKTHVIADMGCGEAALSRRVAQQVRSFDLVASAARVQACDMAHTPLLAGAVDAAVYCLALMGTDLTQYLLEANRVLKTGGHLLIAEVESRFDKVERFVEDVQRLGFQLKLQDKSHEVFFFLEFVKVRDPPVKKGKLPAITLKPCLYKRR